MLLRKLSISRLANGSEGADVLRWSDLGRSPHTGATHGPSSGNFHAESQ
jgi:hypothetical protein